MNSSQDSILHRASLSFLSAATTLFILSILAGFAGNVSAQTPELWYQSEPIGPTKDQLDSIRNELEASRKDDTSAVSLFLEAQMALAQGDRESAARSIAKAVKLDPENIAYLELQLESGFRNEIIVFRNANLRQTAAKILKLDPENATAHYVAGQLAMKEWIEFREGISYRLECDYRPTDPFDIERIVAVCGVIIPVHTEAIGYKEGAINDFWASLKTNPYSRRTALDLATIFIIDKDVEGLSNLVEWLRNYGIDEAYLVFLDGYLNQRQSNFEVAARRFKTALDMVSPEMKNTYESAVLIEPTDKEQRRDVEKLTMEGFWSSKDVRMLTEENERWSEHIARIVYAELAFKDWNTGHSGIDTERGNVYIRYGVPKKEFHLFIMIEKPVNDFVADNAFHVFQYDFGRFVYSRPPMSQGNDHILYSPSASFYSDIETVGMNLDYVISTRTKIKEIPDAYDFESSIARVQFPYFVSRFQSEVNPDEVDVLVSFGIPVANRREAGNIRNPLEAGAFLIEKSTGLVIQRKEKVDEMNASSIRSLKEGAVWTKTLELTSKPGNYDLSVEFESNGSAAFIGLHRAPLPIVEFSTSELQVSDLILASNVEESDNTLDAVGFSRSGFQITPVSIGVFSQTEPVYLYFEAYGLSNRRNDAEYQIQVELTENVDRGVLGTIFSKFRGNQNAPGSIAFSGTTSESKLAQYLILDISETPPGTYVVALKVTDVRSNKSAISSRTIIIE